MSGVPAASFLAPRFKRDTVTYSPPPPQARASTGASESTTTVSRPSGSSTPTSHPNFASIFNAALEAYKRKTKNDLASHPLLPILQSCDSPEAVLTVLRGQIPAFSESHNGDDRLTKWVTPIVNVLYSFSPALGGDVGLVNIGMSLVKNFCSNICFSGILTSEHNLRGHLCSSLGQCALCSPCVTYFHTPDSQAAEDVSSRDKLNDLFIRIEHFFRRLGVYPGITPTTAMMDVIVDSMVEVLSILAIATKEAKLERSSESMSPIFTILN
jgi:hypothetical protein